MFRFLRQPDKTGEGLKRTRETWFQRITHLFDRENVSEELWQELEEALLAADVGVATTTALLDRVRERWKGQADGGARVRALLKEEMSHFLGVKPSRDIPAGSPHVIMVVGVNGVGKTTSIAKLGRLYQSQGKSVLLAAADTFRAAATEQLKLWGERLGVEVIAHQPGADPGAVAFDALEAARSRGQDVLIIDTAGRLHTKFNLMEELKKMRRVLTKLDPTAPHEVLLVLDATIGQNGLQQARYFTEAVGVTGIFLAKLDSTAKGGIVLAICSELKLPVLYLGTGEKLEDLAPFEAEDFVEALFAPNS